MRDHALSFWIVAAPHGDPEYGDDQRAGDLHTVKCSGALGSAAGDLIIRQSGT